MRHNPFAGILAPAALSLFTGYASANIGVVADDASHKVTVFDTANNALLGSVEVSGSVRVGDVLVTADQKKAFVTNFNYQVWVIDLTVSPPTLAAGPNPIPISNRGLDLSLTKDGKYLVVVDGRFVEPISVIDATTQTEISTFNTGSDNSSVAVCDDNSVLVASFTTDTLRRLVLDPATGLLSNTGETLPFPDAMNVYCAPGSQAGFMVSHGGVSLRSFEVAGLAPVDFRSVPGDGISGALNDSGNQLFLRTHTHLLGFGFDPATGIISAGPSLLLPIPGASPFLGMEQMAAFGGRLYLPAPNELRVLDAGSGALLATITAPGAIVSPTGVDISALRFNFSGFHPPVKPLPDSNAGQAGRTIPVRFGLGSNHGPDIFEPGYPVSQQVHCTTQAPIGAPAPTANPGGSGLSVNGDGSNYNYPWQTEKSWAKTCRMLNVRLTDGTERKALFQFR